MSGQPSLPIIQTALAEANDDSKGLQGPVSLSLSLKDQKNVLLHSKNPDLFEILVDSTLFISELSLL